VRSAALHGQLHAVAAQRFAGHLGLRHLQEVRRIRVIRGIGDGARHLQQFVHAGAAAVAGAVAMRAAFAVEKLGLLGEVAEFRTQPGLLQRRRRVHRAAAFADHAHQALGQHGLQRAAHHVARHAHVHQAQRRGGGVVGVQGGEHQVAGHRGAQADLGGFLVAHLTHQHDVRVLAQGRAQHAGKTELDLLVHLHLVDALQAVFDRVLDGDQLLFHRIQFGQGTVQRGGLAAARRASHQHQAVRAPDDGAEALEHLARHAD
jgi:hypothetical protein